MAGRIVLHTENHTERMRYWMILSLIMLLLAGSLCGFSKENGAIPFNKNLWSTSFICVTAGFGLIGLTLCYYFIDYWKVYYNYGWTGAPFLYMGMNSILIYFGHSVLADYMPFSYMVTHDNHAGLLQMNFFGTLAWILVAYYCYTIKFFVKV